MTTYRWYIFGRKVALPELGLKPIEPGTVYVPDGWSRTKEAAIQRRAKLDRAGRQGIMVFSPSRQQAMADVMECFRGVVVEGYISPEDKLAGRALVKAAVMREIFCPYTGDILDMRRAVVVDTGTTSFVCTARHWDELLAEHPTTLADMKRLNGGRPVKLYDGRELFK